jgi:hypothetical protein
MSAPQKAEAQRRKVGLACARKLDQAATALRQYLRACNACGDESASLSLQGKGVDGREKLIADLAEYSAYLDSLYEERSHG